MKKRHKGISTNRLKTNPREKVFADAWEELNAQPRSRRTPATVDYLIHPSNNDPSIASLHATDRECEVAATVIQWLGSPVGWSWLQETMAKIHGKAGE